jgi:hypothetical protein
LIAAGKPLLVLRIAAASPGQQIIEGKPGQRAEVAVPFQSNKVIMFEFFLGTLARYQSAEVRMSEGNIMAQPTPAFTQGALAFLTTFNVLIF